ncbi:hypothetical protein OESDEN_21710 [Oesophagostomum dentatum]|uniref:Uncharacterized protein n=1 Tax=Oesophagostomum dentatum TaxID=61180 RepID=A0A0B1S5C1_OESDE|nr:hypothetical protein OESDEN_21710 [Oesophagostomum dentatum]
MESSFVPGVMDDIYACALLNSPQDKLLETLDLIQKHRAARKRRDYEKPEINDKLIIDPMYARPRTAQYIARPDDAACTVLRECSDIPTYESATLLTNVSSSLALCTAMTEENCAPWTKNDFLMKYEQALHFLEPQLNESLVENIPPSVLISQTTMCDANITVLDRISNYGNFLLES